jgi:hypothetical protein
MENWEFGLLKDHNTSRKIHMGLSYSLQAGVHLVKILANKEK